MVLASQNKAPPSAPVEYDLLQFKQVMLNTFLHDMHQTVANNYDYARFSYDGVDRSKDFDLSLRSGYLEWFMVRMPNLHKAMGYLADNESRLLYIDLIRFRLAGHLHVRINCNIHALFPKMQELSKRFPGAKSDVGCGGMFGELRFYDIEYDGKRYTLDCMKDSLAYSLIYRQYFFERNGVTVKPEPGDYVIDGGACLGDTTIVFSQAVGEEGHVYAFDPVQDHLDVCKHNFARPLYKNVTLFPFGLSDTTVEAPPIRLNKYAPGFNSSGSVVPLRSIDNLAAQGQIKRIDFLKMDIEGAEMAALRGARASIEKWRPKMAISLYHKPNDLFEIIQYVHDLNLGYRLYIDHYTIHAEETVLYCLPA